MTTVNHMAETAEASLAWYWCPTCKLASSKPGDCPGCGSAYEPAPAWRVSDTTFTPKVPGGRSVVAVVISVLVVVLIIGAAIGGVVLLAAHGQPMGRGPQ